jgi:hypothetical protein
MKKESKKMLILIMFAFLNGACITILCNFLNVLSYISLAFCILTGGWLGWNWDYIYGRIFDNENKK